MFDFLGKVAPVAGMINPMLGAGIGALTGAGNLFDKKKEEVKPPPTSGTVNNNQQWEGFTAPWGQQQQQQNPPGYGVLAPSPEPPSVADTGNKSMGSTLNNGMQILSPTNATVPNPNNAYQDMKNTSAATENNVMTSKKDNNFGLVGTVGNMIGKSNMGELGAIGQLLYGINDKAENKRIVDPYTVQMQQEALKAQSSTNNAANNTVASSISGANAMAQRNMDASLGNSLATGGDVSNSALSAIKSNTVNTQLAGAYGNAVAQGAGMSAEGNWRKAATSGEAANQTMYRDEITPDKNNLIYTLMGGVPNVARAGQSFKQQAEDMSNFKAGSENPETQQIFKQIDSNPNMLQYLSPAMRNNYKYYKQKGGV